MPCPKTGGTGVAKGLSMKTTALIIENDASVLYALHNVLQSEDYLVIHAINGEEAMERIKNHPELGVVLLDVNLPRKSGWDVFRDVRLALPMVPVVVIAGDASQYARAVAAGAAAMEKPLEIPRLLQLLTELLAETPLDRLSRLSGLISEIRDGTSPTKDPAANEMAMA